jgi:hypothetical protein
MTTKTYPNSASPYLRGGVYSVTAAELSREIAAERAAAEARIAQWKAGLKR